LVILLGIWFGLFFLFRLIKLETKLSASEHQIYLTTALLYPLLESWIKWMIEKNIIPYSWFWLNRLEHFAWATATVILFLPVFKNIWKASNWWQTLIFILGLVSLLGNINEFLEYYLRAKSSNISYRIFTIYYQDTIYDMIMNIIGGLIGFLLLEWQTKNDQSS
jgi:glycopeptide antibiotics resistance protein